jgi:hypothetical protein
MAVKKTKIVLDADVIHHFAKGGLLRMLPKILPEYKFIVLNIVKRELPILIVSMLDKVINQDHSISEENFNEFGEEKKEFLRLTATSGMHLGRGESACMVYCRFHNDVVGSSNTKDIEAYCNQYGITFLTTNDFLYYAIHRGLLTKEDAYDFIKKVRSMGSYPAIVDFDTYVCTKL